VNGVRHDVGDVIQGGGEVMDHGPHVAPVVVEMLHEVGFDLFVWCPCGDSEKKNHNNIRVFHV
jgi:hypothetical protein